MFKNYVTIALRNLRKYKAYSFINIAGLAVGMACCLLILLYVQDELSYDRFHENADRIYRVVRERQISEHEWGRLAVTPWRIAPLLKDNIPQIERTVRITQQEQLIRVGATQHKEERFFFGDSTFFDIFTFPLIHGDPATALSEPFSVVLTETTAQKYFGDANPLGHILTLDNEHDFTVTGVARDVPEHAHFHFDFMASLQSTQSMYSSREMFESFGAVWLYTYLLLEEGADAQHLEAQIGDFVNETVASMGLNVRYRLPLQPLTSIHLHSNYDYELEANGDATTLYLFSIIAVFILLIACINFMNLATARSSWRAKEVGVRKVIGAHRGHLVKQFLAESILLSVIALGLALMLVEGLLPAFNAFTGKSLALQYGANMTALGSFVVLTALVGLLAGSYPAFYLSSFQPVAVLKGHLTASGSRGATVLRHGLVVFQFAITIVLFISTAVVYQQLRYAQNKKLGFDEENVIAVYLNNDEAQTNYARFKDAFAQSPNVLNVSVASNAPPDGLNTWGITWDGAPANLDLSIRVMAVDYDYLETLDLELAAGRNFSEDHPTDPEDAFLINETAAEQFGFDDPIGLHVRFPVNNRIVKEGEIIGVVKDFHLASLHEDIQPVMLTIRPSWYHKLLVRTRPNTTRETLAFLEDRWATLAPNWPFEYTFLEERLDQLYSAEQRTGQLVGTFSALAILIACLGLFGLAAFTAEQRTKEIGIRKVLGASVANVVTLISKDFLKLVLIAFVLSAPVAYVATHRWLQDFAYRIELSGWTFLVAGLAALGVALLTVSWQAVRAALADPVRALRTE